MKILQTADSIKKTICKGCILREPKCSLSLAHFIYLEDLIPHASPLLQKAEIFCTAAYGWTGCCKDILYTESESTPCNFMTIFAYSGELFNLFIDSSSTSLYLEISKFFFFLKIKNVRSARIGPTISRPHKSRSVQMKPLKTQTGRRAYTAKTASNSCRS